MHQTKKPVQHVIIRDPNGKIEKFDSVKDAIKHYGTDWILNHTSNSFDSRVCNLCLQAKRFPLSVWKYRFHTHAYVSKHVAWTSNGEILVDSEEFNEILDAEIECRWPPSKYTVWHRAPSASEFRREPVRGIHRRRKSRYYRKMEFIGNYRAAMVVDCEEPKVRAKRDTRRLPNTWDDLPRSIEKSWKCFGKKRRQWDRK